MLRPLASSLPLGFFALYGGLALLLEGWGQRDHPPAGPSGPGADLAGGRDFGHQIEQAERELGVRRQL